MPGGAQPKPKVKLRHSSQASDLLFNRNFFTDPEFNALVRSVERGIECGYHPKLISQGSSGSYFVLNDQQEIVGVFKPKDEEPFADNNPKWAKWLQRNLSPCCFGRSCLLSNHGYISEAAASLIDERLGLNVVPKTKIVNLKSKNFFYSKSDRKRQSLPLKIGSLQTFVKDFKDAGYWLRRWDANMPELNPSVCETFLIQFQKMVILDYIIRNTDRSDQNWMIKYDPGTAEEIKTSDVDKSPHTKETQEDVQEGTDQQQTDSTVASDQTESEMVAAKETRTDDACEQEQIREPSVEIAVIDNGLAFPHKHPDSWRMYPFYWANLPYAKEQFCEEVISLLEPKLNNPRFVEELCAELLLLLKIDSSFSKRMFTRQMAVLRGQIYNVRKALFEKTCPAQLPQYRRTMVYRKKPKLKRKHPDSSHRKLQYSESLKSVTASVSGSSFSSHWSQDSRRAHLNLEIPESAKWEDVFRKKVVAAEPSFSCC